MGNGRDDSFSVPKSICKLKLLQLVIVGTSDPWEEVWGKIGYETGGVFQGCGPRLLILMQPWKGLENMVAIRTQETMTPSVLAATTLTMTPRLPTVGSRCKRIKDDTVKELLSVSALRVTYNHI
ncbi:hypothetical protein E3N88_09265 [Mikania micrantha]|uniref:Uncharacterized protein n=1 Tax=Mikania micrantha TaxID=192012 RepID=A0A5N6PIJ2_9ASTR|nr:hypothetical protein E3N88_09265 [Mikania micrantha]